MRKLTRIVVVVLFPVAVLASGGVKVKGIITGADCGLEGMACDLSHLLTGHELLGVFNDKTKRFYFLTNVPQSTLVYLFGKSVTVEGTKLSPDAMKVKVLRSGGKVFFRK